MTRGQAVGLAVVLGVLLGIYLISYHPADEASHFDAGASDVQESAAVDPPPTPTQPPASASPRAGVKVAPITATTEVTPAPAPSGPAAGAARDLGAEARERWRTALHRLGFHEETLDPNHISRRQQRDLPEEVIEKARAGGGDTVPIAAPDAQTIVVPFSKMQVDCAFLNNRVLQTATLIGVDSSGIVTSAVPTIPGGVIPDTISTCTFQPYLDSNGQGEDVTVSYSPYRRNNGPGGGNRPGRPRPSGTPPGGGTPPPAGGSG